MSEGLKALEKICSQACNDRDELFYLKHLNCKKAEENESYFPYCTGCHCCSGNENYKTIEKELRAFEIIKKKKVNLEYLKCCETYEQYKTICSYWDEITQGEFDILKEALK